MQKFVGRLGGASSSVPWFASLAVFGGSNKILYGQRVCRGPLLFARFGQQSNCGVYLLSSGLSSIVRFFTNFEGTTVHYFFITQSI